MSFQAKNWQQLYEQGKRAVIAVCGSVGSGKSTFIKTSPFGLCCKSNVIKLEEIYCEDSRGKIITENIADLTARADNSDENRLLFGVWYCISCLNVRVSEADLEILKIFESAHIPLVVIFTKADEVCPYEIIGLKKSLDEFESVFPYVTYSAKNPVESENFKLLNWIVELWKKS